MVCRSGIVQCKVIGIAIGKMDIAAGKYIPVVAPLEVHAREVRLLNALSRAKKRDCQKGKKVRIGAWSKVQDAGRKINAFELATISQKSQRSPVRRDSQRL